MKKYIALASLLTLSTWSTQVLAQEPEVAEYDPTEVNEPCGVEAVKAARAIYELNEPQALSLRLTVAKMVDGENGETGEAIFYWEIKFNNAQDSVYKLTMEKRNDKCKVRQIELSNSFG